MKIQKATKGSHFIFIPKKYMEKFAWKKGTELDIEMMSFDSRKLIIQEVQRGKE